MPSDDDETNSPQTSTTNPDTVEPNRVATSEFVAAVRQYRPLLPKPPPPTLSLPLRTRSPVSIPARVSLKCGVPQCKRVPCHLPTHRRLARLIREISTSRASSRNELLRYATYGASRRTSTQISRGTTPVPTSQLGDSLPQLSFTNDYPSEFRPLFHAFATDYFYRVISRFRLPLDLTAYRNSKLDAATNNEVLFLSFISHTKFDIMMRRGEYEADRVCSLIYSQITKSLRKKLDDLRDPDIDGLLIYVIALSNFDMLFKKLGALRTHRQGINQLVSARGGVHNLGWSMPYILYAEKRLAIFMSIEPLLSQPIRKTLQLPAQPPGNYGSAFYSAFAARDLSADICQFCKDECRLIDMFERNQISFDAEPSERSKNNSLPQFFFLREELSSEFVFLHAKYTTIRDRNWCVLLATRIVEHPIVYGNYMGLMTTFLADELFETLRAQNFAEIWATCPEVLAWVLFVLCTAPVRWSGREWTENALRLHLSHKFGPGIWSETWPSQQWTILTSLVWSERFLRQPYYRLCQQITQRNLL